MGADRDCKMANYSLVCHEKVNRIAFIVVTLTIVHWTASGACTFSFFIVYDGFEGKKKKKV